MNLPQFSQWKCPDAIFRWVRRAHVKNLVRGRDYGSASVRRITLWLFNRWRNHHMDRGELSLSLQWSGPSDQWTLLPTENSLHAVPEMEPLKRQRALIYARLCQKLEKCPSQCWPRLFYSQPRQLPCTRHPVWKPKTYLQNGLRQLIMSAKVVWWVHSSSVVKGLKWQTITLLNRKWQEKQKIQNRFASYEVYIGYFCYNVSATVSFGNRLNLSVFRFKNFLPDWQTDKLMTNWRTKKLTDGQNQLLNPFAHVHAGKNFSLYSIYMHGSLPLTVTSHHDSFTLRRVRGIMHGPLIYY